VLRGDSRGDETYRRRRQCDDCGYRFNTTERVEKSFDR
jgi:transcriptional regulator NrdR family protein